MRALMLGAAREVARVAATLEGVDGIRLWHDQALYVLVALRPPSLGVDCIGAFRSMWA